MSIIPAYSRIAFTGNPIFVDPGGYMPRPFNIVHVATGVSYTGDMSLETRINIADVAEAMVPDVAPFDNSMRDGSMIYADPDNAHRLLHVSYDAGGAEVADTIMAMRGGISAASFRRLMAEQSDIFSRRFLNPTGNFFLTTRTASWIIPIKETELHPLYFFAQPRPVEIYSGGLDEAVVIPATGQPQLCILDIEEIRRYGIENCGILDNVIDLRVDGVTVCRIVIVQDDPAPERYRLLFRNSYGVWEIMSVVGALMVADGADDDAENASYSSYDSVSDTFCRCRTRYGSSRSLTVETGTMRRDEIPLMMDMLRSPDVYLLDYAPERIKVIPSAEELSYPHDPVAPVSFNLNLTLCDKDTGMAPEYVDGSESRPPGIFSPQFSNQFN